MSSYKQPNALVQLVSKMWDHWISQNLNHFLVLSFLLTSVSCSTYNPLKDPEIYSYKLKAPAEEGVKVTFLGNSTLYITNGETHLLVDGFLSRPGPIQTLLGRVKPNPAIIRKEFDNAGIDKLHGILVGHAHHDHALDAPYISQWKDAPVMASSDYRHYHEGEGEKLDKTHLITVNADGKSKRFGKFTVTFVPSKHVGSYSAPQRKVEGHITHTISSPAPFTDFKHGDVFAIHIRHSRHGNLLVTTTAGAGEGKTASLKADLTFLGIGLLAKESKANQDNYWKEYVENVHAHTIVPIHWDNFSRKLHRGLKPAPYDNVKGAMELVKQKGRGRKILVMDLRDSVLLKNHHVRVERNKLSSRNSRRS